MIKYSGKLLIFGCGGVAQCMLPLLFKHLSINPQNITILDFKDNRNSIEDTLKLGINYQIKKVTKENYREIIQKYLSSGDILIDLAWNIHTLELLDFCHRNNIRYINTSIELWDPYENVDNKEITELTLYHRHMKLRELMKEWGGNSGPTAIVDHGANPGLVSHFLKEGLLDIGKEMLSLPTNSSRKKALEKALDQKDFALIAQIEGVKTIHISERDTQITNQPKQVNEFVNTWSVEGLLEEGQAPSELGWGTHEKYLPRDAFLHRTGPGNQICLSQKGMKVWARSWVPSGEITGMVIRHGEAFSMSEYLSLSKDNTVYYRPTVHYVYCPSDSTINSLHEFEMRDFVPQPTERILNDDIISGHDELGCLIMGHDLGAWWVGSVLDIKEARRLAPHQNATTLQVAIGIIAALAYMIENPNLGVCLPDNLDHAKILKIAKPYLGNYISKQVSWNPMQNIERYRNYHDPLPADEDIWQFSTFVISPMEREHPSLILERKSATEIGTHLSN